MCGANFYQGYLSLFFTTLILNSVVLTNSKRAATKNGKDNLGIFWTGGQRNLTKRLNKNPVVKVAEGSVEGKTVINRIGLEINEFFGIPYAAPPKRFQPPEPPLPYASARKHVLADQCIQDIWSLDYIELLDGSEDCLYLNIQAPNYDVHTGGKYFKVLVYFHGSSFTYGSANDYDATYMTDGAIVVVTVNYRVGPLGFLNSGDGAAGGNMGLKDQVMALRWIQNNIHAFAGDKEKVTIMGHNTGASAVLLHLLSPMSKGLFSGIFAMSGAPLNPWAIMTKPKYMAEKLGEKVDCPGSGSALVECLKGKSADEIAVAEFRRWGFETSVPFGPSIESTTSGEKFLTEDPMKLFKAGKIAKVPVMLGINKEEGLLFHAAMILQNATLLKDLNDNWNKVAPIILCYDKDEHDMTEAEQDEWSKKIREYYFKDKAVSIDTATDLIHLFTDRWFLHGIRTVARYLANDGFKDYVFISNYRYETQPILGHLGDAAKDFKGIYSKPTNGDDLPFLFSSPQWPQGYAVASDDYWYSRQMVKLVTDFTNFGVSILYNRPMSSINEVQIPNVEPYWVQFQRTDYIYLSGEYEERMKFWDGLLKITW